MSARRASSRVGVWARRFVAALALVGDAGCQGAPTEDLSDDASPPDVSTDAPPADAASRWSPDASRIADGTTVDASGDASDADTSCAAQAPIAAGGLWSGLTLSAARSFLPDCHEIPVPTQLRRVTVPAMHRMTVSVAGPVSARVLESCDSRRCVAGSAPWSEEAQNVFVNATGDEASAVIALSPSNGGSNPRQYSMTVAYAPLPPSIFCGRATARIGDEVWNFSSDATTAPARVEPPAAPAHFYTVEVPAGQRLVVSPAPGTEAWILKSCGGDDIGARWRDAVSRSTAAEWRNLTDIGSRVVVALAPSAGSPRAEVVRARIDARPAAPGSVCASAPRYTAARTGLSTRDGGDGFHACMFTEAERAPALWWRVRVPAGRRVSAVVTSRGAPTGAGFGLAIVGGCDAEVCLASQRVGGASSAAGGFAQADWFNASSEEREVLVAVAGDAPLFDLDVAVMLPSLGGVCGAATPLSAGATVTAQRFEGASAPVALCGRPPEPTLYHRITVPADHVLTVTVASVGAVAHVSLLERCEASRCLATGATPDATTLRWLHQGADAQEVVVAVSRGDETPGYSGAYDLRATLAPAPASAHCATAEALTTEATVTVEPRYANDLAADCWGARRPAQFYRITVPPGQRLRAAVSGATSSAVVRLLGACGAVTCMGEPNYASSAVAWTNTADAPRAVLVAVSSLSTAEPFTLSATLSAPPAYARCETAPSVAAPAALRALTLRDAREPNAVCGSARPALYHALRVPARHRLTAQATSGYSSLWLSLLGSCGGECLSASVGPRSQMTWSNLSDVDRDVVLAVEGSATSEDSTVDVLVRWAPIPPAGACVTAPTAESGETLAVTWADAVEEAPPCGAPRAATTPSLYYAVDVPPRQTVTATLRGTVADQTGLRIVSGCGALECLTSWQPLTAASPATAAWRNPGDTARRVYVVASSFASAVPAAALQVDVAP